MTLVDWHQIKKEYLGKTIIICGWVTNIRSHKSLAFLIIRKDKEEIQCLIKNNSILLEEINKIEKESYLHVKGIVMLRNENLINKKQTFGDIEIHLESIEKINSALPLPFQIEKADICSDELKYKFRYLSLRNKSEKDKLEFRHLVVRYIREFFYNKNFIEINTPIITSSTPEGANDYLVLSQKHKGKMYALPQSPQIYKQLLMMGSVEKYFQIAPCFRDESSRKNRLPTEFYQLDVEINHVSKKEEVMNFCNELFEKLLEKFKPNIKVCSKVISYKEAVEEYGCENYDQRVMDIFNFKIVDSLVKFKKLENIKERLIELGIKISKEDDENIFIERKNNKIDEVYLLLSDMCNKLCSYISYCWIINFPFYDKDDFGNSIAGHNPFCKKLSLEGEEEVYSEQYDLVINGEEIGGGSVREIDAKEVIETFSFLGYSKEEIEFSFGGFLKGLEYGAPDHAGIAFGLERLCCFLYNEDCKTRDFVAFPFMQSGKDVLLNTPSLIKNCEIKKYGLLTISEVNNEDENKET